jgi:hypothetical protein
MMAPGVALVTAAEGLPLARQAASLTLTACSNRGAGMVVSSRSCGPAS